MRYFASLDENNVCIGTQESKREVFADNIIEVTQAVESGTALDDFLWRKYEGGAWSAEKFPPAPPPYQKPVSEEIAELKAENDKLNQRLARMDSDFVGFQQFYFEKNPGDA